MITKHALYAYIQTQFPHRYQRKASLVPWFVRVVCSRIGYSINGQLQDIVNHGCSSGCVGEVVYTSDCVALYRKYEKSIWDMVEEFRESTGQTLGQFIDSFRDGIEDEDTLKVFLLWFAVEQIASQILDHFEEGF